jgi:DHA2 family lincomycin resistance protein-like MFS transporter
MGLLGPRVGRVYDARGARVLVLPGALGLLASMAAFVAVGRDTPTWQVLVVHVLLMVSLAALFTPVFTMGLGSLPPHLYSHGSSLLGTVQQVAGAMGTALVVTIMTSRATALVADGTAPLTAQLEGLRWAFAVGAALGVVVLALAALLPNRIEVPDGEGPSAQPGGAPVQRADEHHPELGAGLLGDRVLRLGAGGQDRLGGADHRGDDHVGEHPQVFR